MDEPEVEQTSRVSMEWPASLKELVREKVGARGLTEFVVAAVQRQLADGTADLAVESRDARDLAQRLANVLATVIDSEARLTFLGSVELPDWIDTKTWPNEVLARRTDVSEESVVEEPEIDPVPELARVESVTTTRVEPRVPPEDNTVGTPGEPVIIPEGRINAMDGPKYAALQHVHSPDGRCLKNLFIEKGEDGKKHCPLVLERPEAPAAPPVAPGDNLFDRLKQSGALKSASDIPKPAHKAEPEPEPAPEPGPEPEPATPQPAEAAMQVVQGVVEQTSGPDSGPLPPVPEEMYGPDAVPLPPADFEPVQIQPEPVQQAPEAAQDAPQAGQICPNCQSPLDGGLCWNCGYGS